MRAKKGGRRCVKAVSKSVRRKNRRLLGKSFFALRWTRFTFRVTRARTPVLTYSLNPGFTETLLRPLARRREMTARPLLVFIRVRKPCVFERWRRFGWNVRFGMKSPALLSSATELPQSSERKV